MKEFSQKIPIDLSQSGREMDLQANLGLSASDSAKPSSVVEWAGNREPCRRILGPSSTPHCQNLVCFGMLVARDKSVAPGSGPREEGIGY